MKDSTTEILITFALVIAVGLMCGGFGFIAGIEKGKNKSAERLLSIERRLDLHDRIDSVLVTSINAIYEYLGAVRGERRSVKQDTTITNDSFLGQDPIPLPVGFEGLIERVIYQQIKKPNKWERNPETKKWEKVEE